MLVSCGHIVGVSSSDSLVIAASSTSSRRLLDVKLFIFTGKCNMKVLYEKFEEGRNGRAYHLTTRN